MSQSKMLPGGAVVGVDDFLALRGAPWWRAKPSRLPFVWAVLPTFAGAAGFILSPVFFDRPMGQEWLSDVSDDEAARRMELPSMGMFALWMLGAVGWTRLADRHGRRLAWLCSAWITMLLSVAASGAWSFASFAVLRTLVGFGIAGQGVCAFVMTIEWSLPTDAASITFCTHTPPFPKRAPPLPKRAPSVYGRGQRNLHARLALVHRPGRARSTARLRLARHAAALLRERRGAPLPGLPLGAGVAPLPAERGKARGGRAAAARSGAVCAARVSA